MYERAEPLAFYIILEVAYRLELHNLNEPHPHKAVVHLAVGARNTGANLAGVSLLLSNVNVAM